MIPWLGPEDPFPPVKQALRDPNGLLAAGGDLTPGRLLAAYSRGIFPWYGEGQPLLWWSPDPRMVLAPQDMRVRRSLRKRIARRDYTVQADTAFPEVMAACAEPRAGQDGTWITQEMCDAYCELHRRGIAHSIEVWIDDQLAGGLYGIALGRMFFGESMFTRVTDASKMALAHLCRQLTRWEFGLIDCQMNTAHLASLGAREIKRDAFMHTLAELVNYPRPAGRWGLDDDLFD